jgi:anti-sigma regulatory factor (Ser/Thr protein kinase)
MDGLGVLYPWLDEVAAHLIEPRVLARMHVALEEAVVNAAMHAFAPGEIGRIAVRFRIDGGEAELEVEDDGFDFDPTAGATPPLATTLAEANPGGLGLVLIRALCASVTYSRKDGVKRLTMRFTL